MPFCQRRKIYRHDHLARARKAPKQMKHFLPLMAAIIMAVSLMLTGCGGSTSMTGADPNPNGDLEKIVITTNGTDQPFFFAAGNEWHTAIEDPRAGVEVTFRRGLVGTRGEAKWDYSLFSSNLGQDDTDPAKDVANFTRKVTDLPANQPQTYTFLGDCRVLVKAYEPGTTNLTDMVFVNVTTNSVPGTARLSVAIDTDNLVDENGAAYKSVAITIQNTGTVDARNVMVNLGYNYQFAGSIEAVAATSYNQLASSGPVDIGLNLVYQLGVAQIRKDGLLSPISDTIVSTGYPIDLIKVGEPITIYTRYVVDPNAPGLGMVR
jgi:hypothetical protein